MPHGTSPTPQQPSPAPWPDGVIARYLTVGGATVDITAEAKNHREERGNTKDLGNGLSYHPAPRKIIDLTITAACRGCKDNEESEYDDLFATVADRVLESPYGQTAQRWAQAHAETCRALPRPAVTA